MAKVAEGMARVASGIASGRHQRKDLAREIKSATSARRGEVRSMLGSMNAMRMKETHERAAEAKRMNSARHSQVHSMIKAMRMSRGREMTLLINARRSEMKRLLSGFRSARALRRQQFQKLAAAQRDRAAAFMRHLTSSVTALRDGFAKQGRARAAEIRERLGAYAADRHEAVLIWHGKRHQQMAAQGVVAVQMSGPGFVPAQSDSTTHHGSSAAAHAGQHPASASSHKGASPRQGKDSK